MGFRTKLVVALGALALVPAGAAFAAPSSSPGSSGPGSSWSGPPEGAWTSEDSWDIPGAVVIDERDDTSASEDETLFSKLRSKFRDLVVVDTDLVASTHIHLAYVDPSEVNDLVAAASADASVEGAEPLAYVRAMFTPNDPLFEKQWHMERIGAQAAWDYSSGRGATVAVVDTGVACEDFEQFTKGTDLADTRCVGGWNFVTNTEHANDDQGHGTHVAGTIAQSTNNGIGAVGVAFDARLMPVKVLNSQGWGTTEDVASGIRWAADHGAQVINLSLGGPRNSKIMEDAVTYAHDHGAVVIAAAGNSGGSVGYPGGCEHAVGVSASDENDKLANFSSRGPEVDIAAPGTNVTQQTICNGGKNKCEVFPAYNGTSMATPHVAGVAALLVAQGITDPDAIEDALKSSARVVDDSEAGKKLYGSGILDGANAVRKTAETQAAWRLALLAGLSIVIGIAARKKNRDATSPFNFAYIVGGLLAGPGLFFFAPLLFSRVALPIDLAARPLGDMDLYLGVSWHKYLPLANALIPAVLSAVTFQIKALRPFVAGIAAGTAAYLLATLGLHQMRGPFGTVLLSVWCSANAFFCYLIARMQLAENK
ncbi:MAG: S8 family peptidase [Polyangiaceae bacterium]